jgi:hypothetical protein
MSKAAQRKFSNHREKEKRPSVAEQVKADLKRHPGATATEVSRRTGLAEGSVQWELTRHCGDDAAEVRYKRVGYERKAGMDRPAMTWALAVTTNKPFTRMVVKDLLARLKDALSGHHDLAAEAADELSRWAKQYRRK